MKPEDKALLGVVLAVVVIAAGGAAYFLVLPASVPDSLPVPAGTVFTLNQTEHWTAHFTVGPSGGRLVGAWTAYQGFGIVTLIVVNGTLSKPWPPPPIYCPLLQSWTSSSGTVDTPLGPGPYTTYWNTGYCASADRIVVSQPIQLAGS